jgi:hypothetical protein
LSCESLVQHLALSEGSRETVEDPALLEFGKSQVLTRG